MRASNALSTAAERSGALEYGDKGDQRKQPKTHRTCIAEKNRSTTRVSSRCLLTEADIRAAIQWRLSGVPAEDVAVLADVLRPLAGNFREGRSEIDEIIRDLRYPGDRRAGWSLACAILANDADRRADLPTFWAAGFEVVKSLQQSARGNHNNRPAAAPPDALDALIVEHRHNQRSIAPTALFNHFAEMSGSLHEVLADFDQDRDELVCQLDPDNARLSNVTRSDFARRFKRCV